MFTIPFTVERSITISKPIAELVAIVADFNTWRAWSPWLCQEPECPVTIQGQPGQVGHAQSWDGKRIGTGEMMLMSVDAPARLEYSITFLKPWKSKSKSSFEFIEEGGDTKVTWFMWGALPIFMFFMRKMMTALVGSDYERGLAMLKEYAETGEVLSNVNVIGEAECDGFYYLGQRATCNLSEIGASMEKSFSDLYAMIEKGDIPKPDIAFSFYHQYDMPKQRCEYTSGFGYKTAPLISNKTALESGYIEKHKALRVDHLGPYRHLGNAWVTAHGLLRANKQKASKSVPMYEIYESFPGEVGEKNILTKIHIPIV